MNKFVSLLVVTALLGSSSSVLAYKAGELHEAWQGDLDSQKLARKALKGVSHFKSTNVELFNIDKSKKPAYTVTWKKSSGESKNDSLPLSCQIYNVKVNKQEGNTQFDMDIREGNFSGSAHVKMSHRALTDAGKKFFNNYKE